MLDPADWERFRALAHAAVDDAIDDLQGIRNRPAWQAVPLEVRERIAAAVPHEAASLDAVYREYLETIAPYPTGNAHPRFFGWVHGSGTPAGALAEFLAAMMNSNVGGREHAAVYVERAVIAWACEIFGFPANASGVLTTGSSAANLIALLVARTRELGPDVRERGLDARDGRLIGYTSSAAHSCIRRAFEIAGLGRASLRVLPVNDRQQLDVDRAARAIAEDRASGLRPFVLFGTAGTVDTGAIDLLDALADLAARERLWFHVDGAFGATAILAPSIAPRLRGIERADSLTFDFHKWLHVPYDAGCILVRDEAMHRATFGSNSAYLTRASRGTAAGEPWFTDYTTELSRGFRALKVWFTLKAHGTRKLGEAIEANIRQAKLLGSLVANDPDFELLAPVDLNIVCFRYRGEALGTEADAFTDELAIRVQESGVAVVSTTTIGGRRALRVNITNHRTADADMQTLVTTIAAIGSQLVATV